MKITDIQNKINSVSGVIVEIGGPSPTGYEFLKEIGILLPKNILVTNISNPIVLNPFGDNPETHNVDAVIDIRNLPYKNGEVGMIMTSSLPLDLHETFFKNASKVLKSGGIAVVENMVEKDKTFAEQSGFKPLLDTTKLDTYQNMIYEKVDIL